MPSFDVPGDEVFFTYSASGERSHLALYHDFGDSIANARDADILFIGNSRMPLALREEVLVPAAEALGLKVFSVATGHSESVEFALELLRRHDLRPKVVVAVGGPNYYRDRLSDRGAAVAELTAWQAWKEWFESGMKWSFQRAIHSRLPKLDWFDQPLTTDWVIYRSSSTGWWRPAREPRGRIPVGYVRERQSYEQILPTARELRDEVRDRGGVLVLTAAPYQRTRSGHLPYLSDELGVPAVLPAMDEMFTSDGSHLDRDSGTRFARAFWAEFVSLDSVRRRLELDPPGRETPRVDRRRLAKVRSEVVAMRSMLEEYYGGPEILRETWYLPPDDPRYVRGVDYLADKLARALVWRDRFVIGTIGSSVVAGFDNCRYDTYQEQLERLMMPIWAAAEVGFEVRNAGQGGDCGDSFTNQVWCLRTLVGDDVDMTQYSWTYFESGTSAEEIQVHHELFDRWSLLMERGPVPQLIYTHDCSRLGKLEDELLDAYGKFGANILCMERGIKAAGYPGKKWGVVGDTIHETVRYGEGPGVSEERRKSLGVVFRNWHPGPLLYQTTADAIAYNLSDALLRALEEIEDEPYPAVRWPRRPRAMSTKVLPPPLSCRAEWCRNDVPRCLVYEEPTFGTQFFHRLSPQDKANRHQGLGDPSDAGWEHWQGERSTRYVPKSERETPGCAHPARCAGMVAPSSKQAGWLTFELPQLRLGYVAVCCARKKCGETMLEAGAEFLLDGVPPAAPPRAASGSKCVEVQPHFEAGGRERTVHLGIRLPIRDEPIPAITHVIGM